MNIVDERAVKNFIDSPCKTLVIRIHGESGIKTGELVMIFFCVLGE